MSTFKSFIMTEQEIPQCTVYKTPSIQICRQIIVLILTILTTCISAVITILTQKIENTTQSIIESIQLNSTTN